MKDFSKMKKVAMIAGGVLVLVVLAAVIAILSSGGEKKVEAEGGDEEFVEIQTELGPGWWREPEPTDD